jgi:Tfp pilus assembly protein PilF
MRKLNVIMKSLLGGAAAMALVGCEEVEPPKPVVKPVVTHTAPVEKIDTERPKVETPTPPKIEVKNETPKTVADEDSVKPRKILDDAREALDAGELDRSMKLAKLAVQKMPHRSAAWNTLGRAQLKSGFRSDAIESFQKAVELNPTSSYAENNLGLAFIYEGKFEDAIDALEEAVELEPVEGYMWNNLGMAYEHTDRLDEARDAYRKAADAKAPNASKNLARLEGVKSIRTAKADTVKTDVTVDGQKSVSPVDLPHIEVDGGE